MNTTMVRTEEDIEVEQDERPNEDENEAARDWSGL
jgi:hypothetical protein